MELDLPDGKRGWVKLALVRQRRGVNAEELDTALKHGKERRNAERAVKEKARLAERKVSDEEKAKEKARLAERKVSDEEKAKEKARMAERNASDEEKAKQKARKAGRKASDEEKAKQKARKAGRKASDEEKAKQKGRMRLGPSIAAKLREQEARAVKKSLELAVIASSSQKHPFVHCPQLMLETVLGLSGAEWLLPSIRLRAFPDDPAARYDAEQMLKHVITVDPDMQLSLAKDSRKVRDNTFKKLWSCAFCGVRDINRNYNWFEVDECGLRVAGSGPSSSHRNHGRRQQRPAGRCLRVP